MSRGYDFTLKSGKVWKLRADTDMHGCLVWILYKPTGNPALRWHIARIYAAWEVGRFAEYLLARFYRTGAAIKVRQ